MNYPHSTKGTDTGTDNKELNGFTDKQHLLQVICHTLTVTDLSSLSHKVNSIDLSNQNLSDEDLSCIIHAMKQNKKSFDGIKSINLSNNFFTDNQIIDELFKLFADRFPNLQVLILSNCGIKSNLYKDKKLKSLRLSAAITWFTTDNSAQSTDSDSASDDTFDFIDESDDDDDDDEEADEGTEETLTNITGNGMEADDEKEGMQEQQEQQQQQVQQQQQQKEDYKSTYLSRAIQSILYYR